MTDLREPIKSALSELATLPLREAAIGLLGTLGYKSDRTVSFGSSEPEAFLEFIRGQSSDLPFNEDKALAAQWKSADLLFQLTDGELSGHQSLFKETSIAPGLLRSYLFFAVELSGDGYARGKLTGIARQINRAFRQPVMVLIKHLEEKRPVLSIAVINRRLHKRDLSKDVLGKVTIIRGIGIEGPHRGHLDILASFALPSLVHPRRLPINNFDALHAAWEGIFNVELLNKRFYEELENWFDWARTRVEFPSDIEKDDRKRRDTALIRLLTRVIFCWFLKEKGLVPEKLFNATELEGILVDLKPETCSYYQGILQNLFFATLNQRMGKDKNGKPFRSFALDEGFQKNRATHGVDNLYRYERHFQNPANALEHFADIPFLNGGLFERLDPVDEDTGKQSYLDGFTRNPKKQAFVPNNLFFSEGETVDLAVGGETSAGRATKVRGLLPILHSYKFTIVENTPIDQEIALDPELLGKVFENLLASNTDETRTTARKQTGSFYTPRTIVEYMVDESLKAHLTTALTATGMSETDASEGLAILFAYTEREHPFNNAEVDTLLAAVHRAKILDPACGSGAFPMGMLQKLVYIIHKLDPDNAKWMQLQIDAAKGIPDASARDAAVTAIEEDFAANEDDYGRKLYLIENCLYGVDIQPIAIQISKLRFFISLICDQKTSRNKRENHGIRPLPNLETKFVTADTLIALPPVERGYLVNPRVPQIENELEALYHSHFTIQRRDQKLALQRRFSVLMRERDSLLAQSMNDLAKSKLLQTFRPFDPQAKAEFFDPHVMFGRSLAEGFDIILGNPPYRQIQKYDSTQKAIWQKQGYATYVATGDIYCLFYERGAQLLRQGGQLCYISSNKWMRADYGQQLRSFLSGPVDTVSVLDFGMAQNFGAATTYTCIVRFTKRPSSSRTRSCYATDDKAAMADPAGYFDQNRVLQRRLSEDPWVVISKERQRIKDLAEDQGVPLGAWDVRIFRGVLTGFNDAFYITQQQRDQFVAKDPACERHLVPLLRGRHISRYATEWDGTWMIATFPAYELEFSELPKPIQLHLSAFRSRLEPKPRSWGGGRWEGRKSGSYEWFETQDVIAYHEEFVRPKVILQEIAVTLPFYFDCSARMYMDTTCFMITSDKVSLCYLTALLNSSLFRCCFRDNFPEYSGNAYRVKKTFIEKVPLRQPTDTEIWLFEALVPLVQLAKATGGDSAAAAQFLEDLIDACVMECYFRSHMADKDLLFHAELEPALADYAPDKPESDQREFVNHLHRSLDAPKSVIRNRLLRLTADSPELLAVIKREGKV